MKTSIRNTRGTRGTGEPAPGQGIGQAIALARRNEVRK